MGIIYRIVIIIVCYFLFKEGWNDFKFNWSVKEAKVFTIEELERTPRADIPRYIKVKNVQILSSNYVAEVGKKKGDLRAIVYPVFSLKGFMKSAQQKAPTAKGVAYQIDSTAQIKVKLVVREHYPNKVKVENGEYFKELKNEVEGKYDPDSGISSDTKKLLANGVFDVTDAIELTRGGSPWGYWISILAMAASIIIGLLLLISFLPSRQKDSEAS